MRKENNFDTLRILASIAVLVSHSFPLSYASDPLDPLERISHGQSSLGGVSVAVFFIISGYLITHSFQRSPSAKAFLLARSLRIFPALAAVSCILAFLVGPLASSLPLADYFQAEQPYRFAITNLSLLAISDRLPGVFVSNPFPLAIDGSLWTLTYEARCYGIILCLGVAGCLNRTTATAILLAGLVAMKFWIGGKPIEFTSYFMAGAVIYLWRPPLRAWLAAVCAALWLVALLTGGWRLASASVGAYLVIYVATSPTIRLPNLTRWGDLSYGTYIWAFPVQQLVTAMLGTWACWYLNVAISLPVVLGIAWASWRFIEAPSLALKSRVNGYPVYSPEMKRA